MAFSSKEMESMKKNAEMKWICFRIQLYLRVSLARHGMGYVTSELEKVFVFAACIVPVFKSGGLGRPDTVVFSYHGAMRLRLDFRNRLALYLLMNSLMTRSLLLAIWCFVVWLAWDIVVKSASTIALAIAGRRAEKRRWFCSRDWILGCQIGRRRRRLANCQ